MKVENVSYYKRLWGPPEEDHTFDGAIAYLPSISSHLTLFREYAKSLLAFLSERDGEFYGSFLAVLAVSIQLSGLWLFIKPLMWFLWSLGHHQSPPHLLWCLLLVVLQLLPEQTRGLSELWMSERMQSLLCSFGMYPHLSPIAGTQVRPVRKGKHHATCHLLPPVLCLIWAYIANVLLGAQACSEMSNCSVWA